MYHKGEAGTLQRRWLSSTEEMLPLGITRAGRIAPIWVGKSEGCASAWIVPFFLFALEAVGLSWTLLTACIVEPKVQGGSISEADCNGGAGDEIGAGGGCT